jgi:hypothetical protein
MRYAVAALVGLAAGAALALALLYINPLTSGGASEPEAGMWALDYALPADAFLITHSGSMRLPLKPAGTNLLWERTIRKSSFAALVLQDADGTAVAASRVSLPSRNANLLMRGVLLDDYWLLTVPGEGTLAILADTNVWPLLKEAVPVWYLGREWAGPRTHAVTAGPADNGQALAVGLSGRFAGMRGSVVERYDLRGVEAPNAELGGRMYVRLRQRGSQE